MTGVSLFHVKPDHSWVKAAQWAGRELTTTQFEQLTRYRDWLVTEAVDGGALGPGEITRVETRHIGDSLLFAQPLPRSAKEIWDLGSGGGLPGIPLAILDPEKRLVLVDRSGQRVSLLRRATRVLELANVEVIQGEIAELSPGLEAIVSRATIPPADLLVETRRLLVDGGVAVVGGSWVNRPDHRGWKTISVPAEVLDQVIWLLMMRQP